MKTFSCLFLFFNGITNLGGIPLRSRFHLAELAGEKKVVSEIYFSIIKIENKFLKRPF